MTDTYTGTKKSDWLKCLKAYHSLCRTRSKDDHPIERLRSDYGSELQSHKADEWMEKEGIIFEPSAPYSQEQNGVSERMGRTIMDMTRATILEGNIDDDLWPELVLAMTYVKNSRPTKALQNLSPYEALTQDHPDISHLRVLGSTVYVFLHEEERLLKSEKWAPRALKGTLVGYDGHTIYRVHIKEQNKVIRVKDLRIFEDYKSKIATDLPDYNNGTPTFQGFLLEDNDDDKEESLQTREGQKHITSTRGKGRKVENAESIPSTITNPHKSRSGRTVKLSAKAQEAKDLAHQKHLSPTEQSSEIEKQKPLSPTERSSEIEMQKPLSPTGQSSEIEKRKPLSPIEQSSEIEKRKPLSPTERNSEIEKRKPLSPTERSSEIENLVVQLTTLLENWDKGPNVNITQSMEDPTPEEEEDPMRILATKINSANAVDHDQFTSSTQFDVEEPETYSRAMQGPHAAEWARAMEEELDQLHKNETWTLVHRDEMEPGHRALGGKWVYKIKRDVDGNVARFKARWVVKGYLQQFGVDFDQTFAAVVKPMAFRVLFAIAAFLDLDIDQMDVKTAFLYGLIDQLVYVEIPKGTESDENRNMVCKLLKALYGLKQSPRLWYERLSTFLLEKLGLKRINADHSIFVTIAGLDGPIVSTFVDDIKIMAPKGSGMIERVKAELASAFSMVDMGPISFYLGLKVERDREKKTIKLSQPAYIDKVLAKFHLDKAHPVNTPMKENALLHQRTDGEASASEKERYQGMTGSLMFSMVETRPDIAFTTSVASRFAKNPSHLYIEAVKTILRYMKDSKQ